MYFINSFIASLWRKHPYQWVVSKLCIDKKFIKFFPLSKDCKFWNPCKCTEILVTFLHIFGKSWWICAHNNEKDFIISSFFEDFTSGETWQRRNYAHALVFECNTIYRSIKTKPRKQSFWNVLNYWANEDWLQNLTMNKKPFFYLCEEIKEFEFEYEFQESTYGGNKRVAIALYFCHIEVHAITDYW